jgi:DNA polymerase III delta prime subunit
VKAGRNLVVEGPPGTGKSQTIANIIAELLAAEKTVLFVSEKMAALEVVKSRLDLVGLGDFCLELHSRKSNKKEVLEELRRTIERSPPKSISLENEFEKLDSYKSELNNYAKALKEPLGEMVISPFKLFCVKEEAVLHFEKVKKPIPRIKFSNVDTLKKSDWSGAKSTLSDLAEILPSVKPIIKNPWNGCDPSIVLPSDEREIETLISECNNAVIELEIAIGKLVESCEMQRPTTFKEVINAISAAKVIAISKPIDRDVLRNPEWNEISETTKSLIQKVEDFQKQLPMINSNFKAQALEIDLDSLLKEYKEISAKFFIIRILSSRYRYLKQQITSIYNNTSPNNSEGIIFDPVLDTI